jgi:hypothetical protein
MANLSDLVENLSRVSGVPEATVFAYGRFARQAGAIAQKGRGLAAASMSPVDAANLLIAVAGTAMTKDAGDAVKTFRPLRGHILAERHDPLDEVIIEWLKPHGLSPYTAESFSFYETQITFGSFVEFLIGQCSSGGLLGLLQTLRAAEGVFNDETGKGSGSPNAFSVGRHEEFWLTIVFDRTASTAEVLIHKKGAAGSYSTFSIFFRRSRPMQQRGDLSEQVTITQNSLAALAAAIEGRVIPRNLRSLEQFSEFFFAFANSGGDNLQSGTR